MRLKPDNKPQEQTTPAIRHWLLAAGVIFVIFMLGPVVVGILRN